MSFLTISLAVLAQSGAAPSPAFEVIHSPTGAQVLWWGHGGLSGLMEHDPESGWMAIGWRTITLCSDQDGSMVFRFSDHDAQVQAIAFEPGELLATGDRSGRVVVRELPSGRQVHSFEFNARVRELHFWPRGERGEREPVLQVRCWGGNYSAWEFRRDGVFEVSVQDREAYANLPKDEWSVLNVHEQTWVTHSSGRKLEMNRISLPATPFQAAVDRGGTRLSLLGKHGGLQVFTIPEGKECTASWPCAPVDVLSYGFVSIAPHTAVTADGYSYWFQDELVNSGYTTSTLAAPAHRAVSANGRFDADFMEKELHRYGVDQEKRSSREAVSFRSAGAPKAFAVRNDGAVAIADGSGVIFLWEQDSPRVVGRRVFDITGERARVNELCWIGESNLLFVLPTEGHPTVLDVSTKRRIGEIVIEFPVTEMIAYHPGRDTLLIGGGDRTLREYSRDLEPLGSMEFPGEPLILARPYGETRVLALSNYDHIVHAVDLETWTVLWECDLRRAFNIEVDERRGSFLASCSKWIEERSLENGRLLSRVVFYKGGAWLREAEDGRLTCSPRLDLAVRLVDGRMVRTPTLVSNPEPK